MPGLGGHQGSHRLATCHQGQSSICLCPAAHRSLTLGWLTLAVQAVGPQSQELPRKLSCCWCLILLGVLDGMC